ncbi:MAG: DUF2079 domain-containing protein [Chloroflexi bacterium]|nr:DUF2079 domain-containing protein [Chloroflexota bacterium]
MSFVEPIIIFGVGIAAGVGGTAVLRRGPRFHIGRDAAQWLAFLLVLAWAVLLGTLAVLKQLAFHTGAYDLGIFDQMIWNSAQGRLFENSVMADSPSFLGHHFSPILIVLVPLYWVYPNPAALLAAQALLLALAGLPIFWMARDSLRSPGLALAVLLAYLLHPATAYIALFDFHEVAFAPLLLALALYLLLRQRYLLFGIALGVAFLVKEDIGLVGAATGMFIAFFQRHRLAGLGLAVGGIVWTLLLVRYVIPSFHPSGEYYFSALYANLGGTPREVLVNILRHPDSVLAQMLTSNKQAYLLQMLAPLGALPLLGWPVLIIGLPAVLSLLLSANLPPDLIQYQYSASILPPLLVACVLGLRLLRERTIARWPGVVPGLGLFVVTTAILSAYLYGPLPLARRFTPENYRQAPRLEAVRQLIAQIPPQASVIAQSDLVPQLSHRSVIQLFNFADPALHPDYYLIDMDPKASRFPIQQDDDRSYLKGITRVTSDAEYRLVADREGYLLFKRGAVDVGQRVGVTFGDQITLEGYSLANRQISPGGKLRLTLYLRATRKLAANYSLFAQLLDDTGKLWGQHDGYPTTEYLPTSDWEPGRVLRADWEVPVAPDAPAGAFHLLIGLYDLTTMQRLPLGNGDFERQGDAIVLHVPRPSERRSDG